MQLAETVKVILIRGLFNFLLSKLVIHFLQFKLLLGHCDCGSILKCIFSANDNERLVKVHCTLEKGALGCGKRQLRDEQRKQIAKKLQTESVFSYRNRTAAEMSDRGDDRLLMLHGPGVLRNAKYEAKKSSYLDLDPIKALALLKRKTVAGANVVRRIGYDPFFVHFWSSHQIRIFNANMVECDASLAIDATGKVSPKLKMVNGDTSGHLFLYTATLRCHNGTFPVTRQITECHDTVSICNWLKNWIKSGAKFPREVVSNI